jgi:hypothetical protein
VNAADEWRTLFDGKTSAGWLEITGKPFPDTWTIQDGCLKTAPKPGGMQDIRTVDDSATSNWSSIGSCCRMATRA